MEATWKGTFRWRLPRPDLSNLGLWAIATGHALNHGVSAAFTLLLPFLAKDLGLSFAQVGLLVGMRQVMSMVVNLPAGLLVDSVGHRERLMTASLAASILPYGLVLLYPNFYLLLACQAAVGVGMFLWHPAAITTLSARYPDRRGYGLALHELGANLGDTLAPLAAGVLLTLLAWTGVLAVHVAASAALAAVLLQVLRARARHVQDHPAPLPGRTRGSLRGLGATLRDPGLLVLALVSGVRSLTQNGLNTFLPLYLVYSLRLPPPMLGLYMTLVQASGLVATPLAGSLSDRIGPKRVATVGMTTTSVAVVAAVLLGATPVFVLVLALLGFFLYSMRPALFRWAIGIVAREHEGTTVGLLFTVQSVFSALTPVVGGAVADRFGLPVVFYGIAASVLAGNLLLRLVPDLRKR
ncbi:MAG: MFS transporter [Armatimonadota bacterium]|nr:MFS transporter [Armatimonadota bacterium]MDW8155099.1 MFS transporter [Armatimonadota bacterium]